MPRSAPPLDLRLGESPLRRRLALGAHALALLAVLSLPLAWPWRLLLALLLCAGAAYAAWPLRWARLQVDRAGRWTLVDCHGRAHAVRRTVVGVVHPWLTVLHFRLEDGRARTLAVFPDAMPPAELKALRRRLRGR